MGNENFIFIVMAQKGQGNAFGTSNILLFPVFYKHRRKVVSTQNEITIAGWKVLAKQQVKRDRAENDMSTLPRKTKHVQCLLSL